MDSAVPGSDGQEPEITQNGAAAEVRMRRVFYIPGYDPIHPRRYRELYRKEAAMQAEISGYEISLKPQSPAENKTCKTPRPYGWQVHA